MRMATPADFAPERGKPKAPKIRNNLDGVDVVKLARADYHAALEEADVLRGSLQKAVSDVDARGDDLELAMKHRSRLDGQPISESILAAAQRLQEARQADKALRESLSEARERLKLARNAYNAVK